MSKNILPLDIQKYFRNKRNTLISASSEAITEHGSLLGSHREAIIQIYLDELLPKRFDIGKGIVYSMSEKSNEADIVIWDSANYPKIPQFGHSAYFAESVKVVIEVKSTWSDENLKNIKDQCSLLRNMLRIWEPNLVQRVESLQILVNALANNEPLPDIVYSHPHIATVGIIYKGGHSIGNYLTDEVIDLADDIWPDLLLLLDPGIVVVKNYEPINYLQSYGYIEIIDAEEDSLLYFTAALTSLITDRTTKTDDPWYMGRYAFPVLENLSRRPRIEFPVRRGAIGFSAP